MGSFFADRQFLFNFPYFVLQLQDKGFSFFLGISKIFEQIVKRANKDPKTHKMTPVGIVLIIFINGIISEIQDGGRDYYGF